LHTAAVVSCASAHCKTGFWLAQRCPHGQAIELLPGVYTFIFAVEAVLLAEAKEGTQASSHAAILEATTPAPAPRCTHSTRVHTFCRQGTPHFHMPARSRRCKHRHLGSSVAGVAGVAGVAMHPVRRLTPRRGHAPVRVQSCRERTCSGPQGGGSWSLSVGPVASQVWKPGRRTCTHRQCAGGRGDFCFWWWCWWGGEVRVATVDNHTLQAIKSATQAIKSYTQELSPKINEPLS